MFNKLVIALAPWRVHWSIIFTVATGTSISKILPNSFQGHWYTLIPILITFLFYITLYNFLLDKALQNMPNVTKHKQLVWQLVLISSFFVLMLVFLAFMLMNYS